MFQSVLKGVILRETLLFFNFPDKKQWIRLQQAFLPLKLRLKKIPKEDYEKPVGYLAGQKELPCPLKNYEGDELDAPMLVMVGLDRFRIDAVLSCLRSPGMPKIDYKAVLTPTNQSWSVLQLFEELKKEHIQMHIKNPSSKNL